MGVLDKFLDAIKLNDDYDDDEFFDEDFEDDFEEDEKPRKKFFEKFKKDDDFEDDYLDDEPEMPAGKARAAAKSTAASKTVTAKTTVKANRQPAASSKITPMRGTKKGQSVNMEVCVIKPTSMEDTREIADTLVDNSTVVLNLEGIDVEVAQRIIDFTSGACYSLGGSLQKISSYIFILTPYNVDIIGDFQDILSGAVPSMRNAF
ncbi:MAG: cell division protein SepF [Blautia sp.]|jgi:cell division inhibitor SepF